VISRFFIDRPIFATVLSIVITLTGCIALLYLPVAQYPRITPPGVSISISYPGANAQEVADAIAAPIEQQVNGVQGMLYMSSQSGNDGSYTLTVTFDIGTDVNSALVMVQNRVTLALPQLPTAAQNQGITIRKRTPDMLMIVNFISPDGRYDDLFLSNYATIYAKDELLRVDGISDLNIQGQRDYSMRLWVDPLKLAARNMTVIDVANTINNENIDAPAGRLGQPPINNGQSFQNPIDTIGRLTELEQFAKINVKVGGSTPMLSQSGMVTSSGGGGSSAPPSSASTGSMGGSAMGSGSMASSGSTGTTGSTSGSTTSAGGTYLTDATSTGAASAVPNTLSIPDPPAAPALTDINSSTSFPTPSTSGLTGGTTSNSGSGGMGSATAGGTVGSLGLSGGANSGPQSPAAALVKLSEVARLELGAQNYNTVCSFDGRPSVGFGLYQLPGTNALEVAKRVRAKMEELKADFPEGVDYAIAYDTSLYVEDSVNDVINTLLEAIALVAIVVVIFLQSWRAAIIPLVAVPVSVLGTFTVMAALGFSLNNISLFGLVLAIGIVVDDAIVVVENVERWMEHGLSPRAATYKAMDEVTGPIIAVALVLSAVFVPCAFISGITGQFFRQFAITIAVSTVISTINSLTFSPAMAAILLKPRGGRRDALAWVIHITLGWFFWLFNKTFDAVIATYGWMVGLVMKISVLVVIGYIALLVLTVTTFQNSPKGFIPQQDQGRLIVNVQLPDAASLERSYNTVLQVERISLATPGVGHTITNSGMSFLLQANSPNFASMFIVLKPFDVRQAGTYKLTDEVMEALKGGQVPEAVLEKLAPLHNKELTRDDFEKELGKLLDPEQLQYSQKQILKQAHLNTDLSDVSIMARLRRRWAKEVDAQVIVFGAAPIPGIGSAGGFKFVVEDRGGLGVRSLETIMEDLVDKFKQLATFKIADQTFATLREKQVPEEILQKLNPLKNKELTRGELYAEIAKALTADERKQFEDTIVSSAQKIPYLADAKTQFRSKIPQLYVDIDRVKATALGVSIDDINQTLIMYLGSLYVTSYNAFGRHWQVTIQAEGKYRNRAEELYLFQVRNSAGQMVPLSTLITLREIGGPITVNRYNLYTSAPIQGNVLPGKSDGEAIDAINQVADDTLPLSMRIEWTELMFLQIRAGNTAIWIFLLSVVCVFMALSALYESWALPLAVILVVPLCMLCSVVGVVIVAGKDVNIFVQIGLVVLVGLACKNAILIVEFAKQLRMEGKSVFDATKEASRLRLRPILMTSFAFIFGVMPLMVASGAGAEMRRSLGTAVFSGMLGVTVFGIFLTPVFFYIIQGLSESKLLSSRAVNTAISYGSGCGLGLATGFLLAKLDLGIPLNWGPLIGACAGMLIIGGLRSFHTRIRTRSGSPGRPLPPLGKLDPSRIASHPASHSEGEPNP
jgi:multidrug efflux pump subunit AcrB